MLIAVVVANGSLPLTTGAILQIFCVILKQCATECLKYTTKISQNSFFCSDCCSSFQWKAATYNWCNFANILYYILRYALHYAL